MNIHPETHDSLIVRLGDCTDQAAWMEFVEIYEPMLRQLTDRWGLQKADADEVVQETLLAVVNAIPTYQTRSHGHAFRGWLAAITRNKLTDLLKLRRRQINGTGDTDVHQWLDQQAETSSPLSVWDWSQKQQIFRWAAHRVQAEVHANTWEAFHRTQVMSQSVAVVAQELGIREGMVYVARSRVMSKLRKTIAIWESTMPSRSRDQPELPDGL